MDASSLQTVSSRARFIVDDYRPITDSVVQCAHRAMGNTESVVVQKRLARFRPEERPVVEGVFDRLHGASPAGGAGKAGKVLTLGMLKVRVELL